MAIFGTHTVLYTSEPEALRAILRDVFGFAAVDSGGGWLMVALPPAEMAVHPAEGPTWDSGVRHQIAFMCDDLPGTVADLRSRGVEIPGEPEEEPYGTLITMRLPGGLPVLLYEPKHRLAPGLQRPHDDMAASR